MKGGAKIHDMTAMTVERWRSIAVDSAWNEFASLAPDCARLFKLAQEVKAQPDRLGDLSPVLHPVTGNNRKTTARKDPVFGCQGTTDAD